ncbi:MAG TPA: hypothetical protein VE981_20625 [Planctomycetota bacterium]|nr:hypothetical protein [Planctomycetota bacterium]
MKLLPLALAVVALAGCASSGPAAPPLPHAITLVEPDFEEQGGIIPMIGTLTLTITPEGEGTSVCKRQLFTDVERRAYLTNEERWELSTKVEAWVAAAGRTPPNTGKPYGTLAYGDLKATWEKGAVHPLEQADLILYLKKLVFSLNVVRKRG